MINVVKSIISAFVAKEVVAPSPVEQAKAALAALTEQANVFGWSPADRRLAAVYQSIIDKE